MRWVLGHSLLRSLVHSHRSLIRLLRTARFARALCCAHSFARSLAHSGSHGKVVVVHGMNASFSYSFKPLCMVPSARLNCTCGEKGHLGPFKWRRYPPNNQATGDLHLALKLTWVRTFITKKCKAACCRLVGRMVGWRHMWFSVWFFFFWAYFASLPLPYLM